MIFQTVGSFPEVNALLFDAALKGAVLLALASVVTAMLRRASAASRHHIWSAAIVGILAIPLLSVAMPQWSILPQWFAPRIAAPAEPAPSPATTTSTNREASAGGAEAVPVSSAPVASSAISDGAGGNPSPITAMAHHKNVNWLLLIWASGFVIALSPVVLGTFILRTRSRKARHLQTEDWTRILDDVARDVRLRRETILLQSSGPQMPMAWGILRARILLPAESEGWPPERRRAVLLHEMGHIRRGDCLTQFLTSIACALYWFNPLIWYARRRMMVEREHACDDLVLAAGFRSSDYAEQLLEVAAHSRVGYATSAAAIAMARSSKLERRLAAVLDEERNRKSPSRLFFFFGLVAAMGAAAALATLKAQTPDAKQSNVAAQRKPVEISGSVIIPAGAKWPDLFTSAHTDYVTSEILQFKNGRFSLNAPAESVTVFAVSPDLAPAIAGPFDLSDGQGRENVEILMEVGYPSRVRFVSSAGGANPKSGSVLFSVGTAGYSINTKWGGLPVNENGVVEVEHASKVPLVLTVASPGFQPGNFSEVKLEPDKTLELKLDPAGPVAKARIMDAATGKPVTGAKATLQEWRLENPQPKVTQRSGYMGGCGPLLGTSDSEGLLTLDMLSPDLHKVYRAEISADGYAIQTLGPFRAGQDTGVLRLQHPLTIIGKIRPSENPKATMGSISAYQPLEGADDSMESHFSTLHGTDAEGARIFKVEKLHKGKVVLNTEYGRQDGAVENYRDWKPDNTVTYSGPGTFKRWVMPNKPGRMRIEYAFDLTESVDSLVITPDGVTTSPTPITITSRFVWGRVLDEQGKPLAGARILLQATLDKNHTPGPLMRVLYRDERTLLGISDADGQLRLGLPEGIIVWIAVDCEGYPLQVFGPYRPGDQIRELRIQEPLTLSGEIKAPADILAKTSVIVSQPITYWFENSPCSYQSDANLATVPANAANGRIPLTIGGLHPGRVRLEVTFQPEDISPLVEDSYVQPLLRKSLGQGHSELFRGTHSSRNTRIVYEAELNESLKGLAITPEGVSFAPDAGKTAATPFLQLRRVIDDDEEGPGEIYKVETTGEMVRLSRKPSFTEADIASATVSLGQEGIPQDQAHAPLYQINFKFRPEAVQRFAEFTDVNRGRRLAIIFNGKVLMAPRIMMNIAGGIGVINVTSKEEAQKIADALNKNQPVPADNSSPTGALPQSAAVAQDVLFEIEVPLDNKPPRTSMQFSVVYRIYKSGKVLSWRRVWDWADQAGMEKQLTPDELRSVQKIVNGLPGTSESLSRAQSVFITRRGQNKDEQITYNRAALPPALRKLFELLGTYPNLEGQLYYRVE